MTRFILSIFTLLTFQSTIAQNLETKIKMVASSWNYSKEATFEKFDNRETVLLNNGRITVKNHKFKNGIIEVDVLANESRSFAGITFRKQNENMEEVYMRLHKSNQVDAVQYTPIFNNESNWQLYKEYQALVSFKKIGWNNLRIEVKNKVADVFVNGKKILTINELKTNQDIGEIGLFALFSNRFSNFKITTTNLLEQKIVDNDISTNSLIINKWLVTKSKLYNEEKFNYKSLYNEDYVEIKTETSGLLPISKHIKKSSSGNFEQNKEEYVITQKNIHVDSDQIKLFSFDYSDKIIVYLNGSPIFKGNNAFRSKGLQYQGHIDINSNKLYLNLKKGKNTLHCVIIDKANGWGLIGKLD
ncbi:family 16 glycoside hydrolase [Maribacter litoralis]|uniref:family 16 glycoside hydrolase n=1 Tax=Maribacter litoralis TaxID=2059726 RepID=UPI003F5CF6AA